MEYSDREYCLEVWGDYACFTRPELKVERVSYEDITPSAARAIFEAILFKKYAMRWQVTKIEVLNPIKWVSVRRNEVGATATTKCSDIYIEDKRQQKNSLFLKDVRYRIWAKLIYIPVNARPKEAFAHHKPGSDENPMKYYQMFERRAQQGQCFTQPYLGTREFSASFRLVDVKNEDMTPALSSEQSGTRNLGIMLYDLDFTNPKEMQPLFYMAEMNEGVIIVPPLHSKEILR